MSNKKSKLKMLLLAMTLIVFSVNAFADPKVTSIDFKSLGTTSEILIRSDAPITFDKSDNAQDRQVVLDIKGASLAKTASRSLDTSSFPSSVSLVSPYSVENGNSRIVIQLREMQTATVSQDGNVIKISVPNGIYAGGVPNTAAPAPAQTDAAQTPAPAPTASAADSTTDIAVSGNEDQASKLEKFMQNQQQKRFNGKPITLQLRDADLGDVFRLIGEASGFNIVVGDEVKGKITLSLVDVPWDQALDVVLHTEHLGAERNNNLLRIVTLQSLTQEKQQELAAKQASEASAPRITRIFPINYASLTDLTMALQKFASPNVTGVVGGAAGAPTANLNIVQPDTRTNSVIVRDTAENVERMKKLIEILDTQTPQVQIEAKIIETTEQYQKALNGALGLNAFGGAVDFNGGSPGSDLVSAGGVLGPNFPTTVPGMNAGITPQIGILQSIGVNRINALLSLGESDSDLKILASPRSVVLDRENTTILSSTPVLTPTTTTTNGITTTTQVISQANISLNVTPTVTNEGSILMQLTVSKDVPFPLPGGSGEAVANRNMTSKVLVQSGSTLVMGGIFEDTQQKGSSGVPYLRKLPLIGWLFGSESVNNSRTELMFFITPKILNSKEAGLGT